VTIGILLLRASDGEQLRAHMPLSALPLLLPYVLLLLLPFLGINILISLLLSLIFAAILGMLRLESFGFRALSDAVANGFSSMNEIMVLSMMIGAMSGLMGDDLSGWIGAKLQRWRRSSKEKAQLAIGGLVSLFDLLMANNTIAIILSGGIAREISRGAGISPERSAALLGIFSCVFQGIIPYGAQLLLAGSIGDVSPMAIAPKVYYCYVLAAVTLLNILLFAKK
jgi:Na+/H+ antiporter NhaC